MDVKKMPEWSKPSTEKQPLSKREPNGGGTLENNGDTIETFIGESSASLPPPDFIYRLQSPQSADNPYATQPAYNSSYKLVDDTIIPQINDIELATTVIYPTGQDEVPTEQRKDSGGSSSCVIVCLVAIVIAAMAWVVYLITRNPKIARALQRIANEARRTHEEDTSNKEETPLFRRMFSPVINSESSTLINGTSWS